MKDNSVKARISGRYIAVTVLAVFLSWILHELAHWSAGEYLGYKMAMTLNATYPLSGQNPTDLHNQIISAAGPVFTLLEAITVFILMTNKRRVLLYPFLFTCFYMRVLAAGISFLNPNDEARISTAMGIGKFTLPLIVSVSLFALIYKISKQYKFGAKFNFANLGLVIFFSSLIILADMFFKIRLL